MNIHQARTIQGEITVPGDKSISHRAVMLGSLAEGITKVKGFLKGEDCLRTVDCFKKMGVSIEMWDDELKIYGRGLYGLKKPGEKLYAGNSGTTMRLLLGILSGQNFEAVITGDESLKNRPMARVTNPLRKMGAKIDGRDKGNLAPLKIRGGGLRGIDYEMPIASAQVKSALLFAGMYASGITRVIEPAESRNHTEIMMEYMGADIKSKDKVITVTSTQKLKAREIYVPGDISSASFFIVAGCILPKSQVIIKDVGVNPTRTGIIEVLKQMGGKIQLTNLRKRNGEPIADIYVTHSDLKGVTIKGDLIPRVIDEIPVLAVAGAFARGRTVVKDAAELKVKESNRIETIVEGLKKMGAEIKETPDGFIVEGGRSLSGAQVDSYGDHRIAMALAIAALKAESVTSIDNWECVKVSFPRFGTILQKVIMKD